MTSFLQEAHQYHTIPIVRRFFLDTITPIQLFQKLNNEAVFLLESRDPQSPWSNYSFIGLNPYGYLNEEDGCFFYQDNLKGQVLREDDFQSAFQKTMNYLNVKPIETSVPFYGGAVGYMGYDAMSSFASVPEHENNDLGLQRLSFLFCETILALDHTSNELQLFHHIRLQGTESDNQKIQIFEEEMKKIESVIAVIENNPKDYKNLFFSINQQHDVHFERARSNYNKDQFMHDVKKIQQEIAQKEISQAVLSQRFEVDISVSGLDIYRALRVINPSPYLFYLNIEGIELIGSSPERLVQVKNRNVEIHPIAGTRKRGHNDDEDEALCNDLLADEKERAEHFMLVDLARHDVAQVSEYESVKTPVLAEVGRFSHVMHLISKVTGVLRADQRPIDALLAASPAGTVSGAPKSRAMQLLQLLEPTARNHYAGAIGYLGFDGNIDACIAIRTLMVKDHTAFIQAGAGIVAQSIPFNEWEETRNKAKALLRAIEVAEDIFDPEKPAKGEDIHV